MARPLQSVRFPMPIDGVVKDVHPNDLPPTSLRDAENWIFRDAVFQVRPGVSSFSSDVNQRPMTFIQYPFTSGTTKLVMGTDDAWWKYNDATGNWDDLAGGVPLTGITTDFIAFRVFNKAGATYLLGINGADVLKKWDGVAAAYSSAGGSPPKAKCMSVAFDRVLLGHLLSGGTISPQAVDVSARLDFDSGWGATQTTILADTPGSIVAMQEMGSLQTAIYKTDAVHVAIAQGALAPFRFELRAAGIAGPAALNALVPISDSLHVWLGNDGSLMQFDGVNVKPLSRNFQMHVLATADVTNLTKAYGVWDAERSELLFMYPEVGSLEPNLGVFVSVPSMAIWPIRFATLRFSAATKIRIPSAVIIDEIVGTYGDQTQTLGDYGSTTFRQLVFGEIGGQNYKDTATTDNAAAISNFFETGLSDGGSFSWKTFHEMDHLFRKIAQSQTVTTKIGYADAGEDRTLTAGVDLDIAAAGARLTGHRVTARRFSARIESLASQPISWQGAQAAVTVRGTR